MLIDTMLCAIKSRNPTTYEDLAMSNFQTVLLLTALFSSCKFKACGLLYGLLFSFMKPCLLMCPKYGSLGFIIFASREG